MTDSWHLDWPGGRFDLHALGGGLDRLHLPLADGRSLAPLYRAPWLDEPQTPAPGSLAYLRGEFVCLPWGSVPEGGGVPPDPADGLAPEDLTSHGWPALARWELLDRTERSITIGLDFPAGNALARLRRQISVSPDGRQLTSALEVEARRACRRSFAFHPSFALPQQPGAVVLRGGFRAGLVMPAGASTPGSLAQPGATFTDLTAVPLAAGGTAAFDRLPLEGDREEILMLSGADGHFELEDRVQQVIWSLDWDASQLPSVALWMSNRGRRQSPWNGHNLCLGVEPCAAAFGGAAASLADNQISRRGIPTALDFRPGEIRRLSYTLSGRPL